MIRLFKESFRYVIKRKKNTNEYDKKTPLILMCALSFQRISRENTCMKSWLPSNYRHTMGVKTKRQQNHREKGRNKTKREIRVHQQKNITIVYDIM